MEAKILGVLRESERPLNAKEIAGKLSCAKKAVNQVIHKMNGVVKKSGTEPPQWLLAEGTKERPTKEANVVEKDSIELPSKRKEDGVGSEVVPKGASPQGARLSDQPSSSSVSSSDSGLGSPSGVPSDAEIKEEIVRMLSSASSPISAPDIFKKLPSRPKDTATVKRLLHEMERKGEVEKAPTAGQRPFWRIKQMTVGNGQAKLDNKALYTLEPSKNGTLTFQPVSSQGLVDSALKQSPNGVEGDRPNPRRPMLECVDEVDALPIDAKSEEKETAKQAGSSEKKSPVQGEATSRKRRINLAANFKGLSINIEKHETLVLSLLQSNPSQVFTCDNVREKLHLETRDIALACLRNLVRKGLVLERKPDETTGSSQFQYKSP